MMWRSTWRLGLVLAWHPREPANRESEAEVDKTDEDVRTLWIYVDGACYGPGELCRTLPVVLHGAKLALFSKASSSWFL